MSLDDFTQASPVSITFWHCLNMFKHVRCSPDVAPHLTSGGYEDTVDVISPINILFRRGGEFWPSWRWRWCYYPNQHIVHRGWRMLIPHGDVVDVSTPTNILFRGGSKFWPLVNIKLMLLPQSTFCSEGVAKFSVMMIIIIIIMTIVSVEQRPGWVEHV